MDLEKRRIPSFPANQRVAGSWDGKAAKTGRENHEAAGRQVRGHTKAGWFFPSATPDPLLRPGPAVSLCTEILQNCNTFVLLKLPLVSFFFSYHQRILTQKYGRMKKQKECQRGIKIPTVRMNYKATRVQLD